MKLAAEAKETELLALHSRVQLLDKTLSEHKSHIQRMDRKNDTLQETVDRAHGAEEAERQAMERLHKQLAISRQEMERRDGIISTLKAKLEEQRKLELTKRANNESHDTIVQEAVRDQLEHVLNKVSKEHQGMEARLRHENVTLKASMNEQKHDLETTEAEKTLLERKSRTMEEQSQDLVEQNRRLEYEVQRKEHDVNIWKAKCEEIKRADPTEQFQAEIAKLKRNIEGCRNENDRLQRLWMKSQQDLLTSQNSYNQLTREHNFLKV